MKRVLFTGGSGFIGRNIISELGKSCSLYAPTRQELNLLDQLAVEKYIIDNKIDIVIHGANPNPVKNSLDKSDSFFEDSIRVFLNLYRAEEHYEMMYTLGSGAEYDKSKDIDMISEDEYGRSIPYDTYGLIKYTIHQMIEKSDKQCNLRLFAVYGPTDHESKFITHVINRILEGEDITIRQDCLFDYMQVMDLVDILRYFIDNKPRFNAYNISTGKTYLLSEIAEMVRDRMKKQGLVAEGKYRDGEPRIILLKDGYNNKYTADNSRLLSEIGDYSFTDLCDGIDTQIAYERDAYNAEKSS